MKMTAGGKLFMILTFGTYIFLKNFGCIPHLELDEIMFFSIGVVEIGEFLNKVLASGRDR